MGNSSFTARSNSDTFDATCAWILLRRLILSILACTKVFTQENSRNVLTNTRQRAIHACPETVSVDTSTLAFRGLYVTARIMSDLRCFRQCSLGRRAALSPIKYKPG